MSQVLFVYYELIKPAQNAEAVVKKIKAYGTWARIGTSAYLIKVNSTPEKVRDDLMTVLGANDKVFVGTAPRPSAWGGLTEDVSKWILGNQE